jgi:hypothetical protein
MSDKDQDSNLQDAHNKGQEDASKGTYSEPHTVTPLDDVVYGSKNADEWSAENEAYRDGWSHGHDQKK